MLSLAAIAVWNLIAPPDDDSGQSREVVRKSQAQRVADPPSSALQPVPSGSPLQGEGDPFAGLWKPVNLDLSEVNAEQALEMIFRQAGEPWTPFEDIPEKKISVRLKGLPFWKAVDEVCRLHGGFRLSPRPFGMPDWPLTTDAWTEYPVVYRGPLRIFVYDAARIREVLYPNREDRTELSLVVHWTNGLVPARTREGEAGCVRLHRVQDDTGKSLLPLLVVSKNFNFIPTTGTGTSACEWLFPLQPAADTAKTLSILEGEWEGSVLSDLEQVTFVKPAESVGVSHKVGPFDLTLVSFEKQRSLGRIDSYGYRIRLSYDEARAGEELKNSLGKASLQDLMDSGVRIVRAHGSEYRSLLFCVNSDAHQADWSGNLHLLTQAGDLLPEALIVRVAKSIRIARAGFSLRDIPLAGSLR